MKSRRIFLVLSFALSSTACAERLHSSVTKTAAADFGCPTEQVEVSTEAQGALAGRYRAQGCDRDAQYVGQCSLLGICRVYQPSATPAYATTQPTSAQPASARPASYSASDGYDSSPSPSPAPAAAPAPAAPAAPTVVSVRLRNTCPETVKLFFGDKPKFGSGTYSSLGSNTSTSKSMRPGDMIWLVDDSQNGLSSVSIGNRSMTVEVTSSCTGFTAR